MQGCAYITYIYVGVCQHVSGRTTKNWQMASLGNFFQKITQNRKGYQEVLKFKKLKVTIRKASQGKSARREHPSGVCISLFIIDVHLVRVQRWLNNYIRCQLLKPIHSARVGAELFVKTQPWVNDGLWHGRSLGGQLAMRDGTEVCMAHFRMLLFKSIPCSDSYDLEAAFLPMQRIKYKNMRIMSWYTAYRWHECIRLASWLAGWQWTCDINLHAEITWLRFHSANHGVHVHLGPSRWVRGERACTYDDNHRVQPRPSYTARTHFY